jgi:prolyl-tRNA synthetase
VVLGRNLAEGTVEVRDRRTGDKRDVALAQAVDEIVVEVLGATPA